MTISPTFCASAALVLACCLMGRPVLAHDVSAHSTQGHTLHEHAQTRSQTRSPATSGTGTDARTPGELIQAHSRTGDDSLLEIARLRVEKNARVGSPASLLHQAWIAQAEHRFADARELLAEVLEQQPGNGQAWLLEASVAQVAGQRSAARRACAHVAGSVSPDAAMTCFARLADTPAEKKAAYARLRALDAWDADPRLRAWRWSVRADLARDVGELDAAESDFYRSLAAVPAVQTRASLMDLLLEQQRCDEALQLSAQNEPVPALAVRRLLAQQCRGEETGEREAALHALFQHWIAAGDYRHAREMAMFYLDIRRDPELAFQVASKNARLQREPEDLALLRRAAQAI